MIAGDPDEPPMAASHLHEAVDVLQQAARDEPDDEALRVTQRAIATAQG